MRLFFIARSGRCEQQATHLLVNIPALKGFFLRIILTFVRFCGGVASLGPFACYTTIPIGFAGFAELAKASKNI
ncbi:hypothetical protein CA264_12735 [Pontibacter actiniarum]|uniref:Uncharacterized protein n=1 Tax=Pontibacter actiniarum TaxID=323450 RepID=A0A1X9YTT3_9BACT|nr:hypothetical protein CA264_12735 [Pontibacter actiniarum]